MYAKYKITRSACYLGYAIQAVVNKFIEAVKNIEAHNFEPTSKKSKENCKFCQFKDFCDLDVI